MNRLIWLLTFTSSMFISCNERKTAFFESKGEVFHTYYSIQYEYTRSLDKEIWDELMRFDNSLNPFNPASTISKINSNESVIPDSLFCVVFNKAYDVSVQSDGLFDITCSPFINAWGFGFKNMDNVTDSQIDSLRAFVGYNKIRIENDSIKKDDPRVQVNTSAIAKGFSVDVIARLLKSYGITNYKCEIGGEIAVNGNNTHGELWRIGIDKPIDEAVPDHRELQIIVKLFNKSIATSGNYRNFYLVNGKKYAHTINPRTGYPAEGSVLSATVIADDCMTADAYATVFMLTDKQNMHRIANDNNLDVYIIYIGEDGNTNVEYTEGFTKYIVQKK